MAQDPEEHTTSVDDVLIDKDGRIQCMVVMSDGENFHSIVAEIADISVRKAGGRANKLYRGDFWLTAMARTSSGAFLLTDSTGRVHTNLSGAWAIENVSPGHGLRCLWVSPEERIYCGGTDGIVYERVSGGWVAISPSLGNWLTAITGQDHSDLLAVGDNGLVARFDGASWTGVDLGTNVNFNATLLDTAGDYLICGTRGTLFRGRGDAWVDISSGETNLFDLVTFANSVWVACGPGGVGRLTDSGIEIVKDTFAAFAVDAAGQFLAACGNNIVGRFDGENWFGYRYQ
ncbi:MAG: hypothetical protein ABWZ57_02340 [Mesorhizobium sp.]